MPGMHGTAAANYAIHHADLIIAIGMRFDDRITGKISEFGKTAKVIHIDIDPAEINKCIQATLPIIGDAKEILKELNAELKKTELTGYKTWQIQLDAWQAKHPLFYEKNDKVIKPQYVLEMINELTAGEAIVVTDVGEHQMWSCQYVDFKHPRHWASSGGLGTMGFGVPAAMGAAFGNPDKQIICISGDGSFQMNLQELGTIATNKIPVKIFILNNHYLGMVRQWQSLFYGERFSQTDLTECQPDFMKLAEAYGIKGVTISNPAKAKEQIKEILKYKGPVLTNVLIAREENVFPMVPPGGILNKMIFHPEAEKSTERKGRKK